MTVKRVGDLEIDQDVDFQKKEWVFERWGWVFMLILLTVAMLGLFGQGPLSHVAAESGALTVNYELFARLLAPAQLQIHVDSAQATHDEVRLHLDQELLARYTLQHITPEPASSQLAPNQITYVFKTGQGEGLLMISLELQARQIGLAQGRISVDNVAAVDISQFIYP